MVRHMHRQHADKSQYVGYNELTGYTFTPVGDDYPHIVMATHPTRQAIGYCMQCFTGFHGPAHVKNPVTLAKHFKTHTCAEKQVRTRKVTVTTEDGSGNVTVKKETQTGGYTVTEEMLSGWKKQYPRIEIKLNDNLDYDIESTVRKAIVDSHMLDAVKAQQKQQEAVAQVASTVVTDDMYLCVMQSFVGDNVIGALMAANIKAEQAKAFDEDLDDPEEADYRKALRTCIKQGVVLQKKLDTMAADAKDFNRKCDELEDAADRERAHVARLQLELQQERMAAARREQEQAEEIRQLRAALQQYKSQEVIRHEV